MTHILNEHGGLEESSQSYQNIVGLLGKLWNSDWSGMCLSIRNIWPDSICSKRLLFFVVLMFRNTLPIICFQGNMNNFPKILTFRSTIHRKFRWSENLKFQFFFTSSFGPSWLRKLVSDFAVILAIIIMVLIDMYLGPDDTPKLFVPDTFKPTRNDRGILS